MNQPFGSVTDPVVGGKGLATIRQSDVDRATDLALSFSGGGLATRDPALFHTLPGGGRGISSVKLQRPLADIPRSQMVLDPRPSPERLISPESLQGSVLVPGMGDRSAAGYAITHVGDKPLTSPVDLYGGHGFMSQDPSHIWASKQGAISGLGSNIRDIAEQTGKPVQLTYTAMGPQSVDFSTFMSDALADQLKTSRISKEGAAAFDKRMRDGNVSFKPVPDFPGVRSANLQQWLREQPGRVRDTFAKHMDKSEFLSQGFPNVGETRHAIIDPRLMNTPLGGAGLSIARADPTGAMGPSTHPTYSTGLKGTYTGGLGESIPFDVMFPDMAAYYASHPKYSGTRFDKLATTLAGDVKHQEANQQWLDNLMRWRELQQRR
jgi:hypothetical protein